MNRLAREQSPYLLQHAGNPVDWYPWGEEAFAKARSEDKPIFLSIGYSTCHWCHVMEHESFEQPQIASLLNADFVSIKVDREERPDVDRVYMAFVQSTTGQGGWPMTVFLTPDLKPFFGGTYFPPTSRRGRPGFPDLLGELARVWKHDRAARRACGAANCWSVCGPSPAPTDGRQAKRRSPASTRSTSPSRSRRRRSTPRTAASATRRSSRVPPNCCSCCASTPAAPRSAATIAASLAMVTGTLRGMALGGMRDHVGGGFHRYSVDAEWRVPHFEKMLYDQAQLVLAYLEAAQATGDGFYVAVAEDTLEYVLRDLTDPEGGFYSAEDADSVPPEHAADPGATKMEGAFYIWTDAEIGAALGGDAGDRPAPIRDSRRAATRRRIRKGSFAARTSSTSPRPSRSSRRIRPPRRWMRPWRASGPAFSPRARRARARISTTRS